MSSRLTESEQAWFWRFAEAWLSHEAGDRLMRGTTSDQAVDFLIDVLTQRRTPTSVLDRLAENATPVPARRTRIVDQWGSPENEFLIVAAAAALGAYGCSDAEHRLRLGTRSPKGREGLAAWKALEWWIEHSGRDAGVPLIAPSAESVRDIGVAVGTTQKRGLLGALRAAHAVYQSRNPELIEAVHSPVIQRLRRLRSELNYRSSVADRLVPQELPLHRHWCVWLAWAMTDAEKGDDVVVRSWIEAGDGDPLVIVRFVRERNAASKVGGDSEKRP